MKLFRTHFALLVLFALALNALPLRAQQAKHAVRPSYAPFPATPSEKALKYADKELKRMTTDEKVGQLISIGINANFLNENNAEFLSLRHHITENKVGGIVLFRSPVYESVILVNRLQQIAKYPLLISADLEAGAGMRFDDTVNFPWNMAVAATGDPQFAFEQGRITAREARAMGIQQIFAPVTDVNNNAANPVINVRSYSEDPATVAQFANAFIRGAQAEGVIATAKHFPGHGDTAIDSHRGLPSIAVDRARLDRVEFVPFKAAIDAGVGSVMVGHIALPQIDPTEVKPLPDAIKPMDTTAEAEIRNESSTLPATLSPRVTGELLQRDLKFRGLVVTDAMSMSGLTIYFQQDEAAVRAFLAGADVLLKPADVDAAIRGLRAAVASGRISQERLNTSVRKILAAKFDLGLIKDRLTDVYAVSNVLTAPATEQEAQIIADRAITLVRNTARLVPLKPVEPRPRIVNLVITNGDDRQFIAGSFNSTLQRAGVRAEIVTLDMRSGAEETQDALNKALKADLVIASLYGRVRSGSANSVGLPDAGVSVVNQLIAADRRVVGISFGNPYVLQTFPQMKTYLVAYGDMPALQRAAARALVGAIDITGKLPISLPGLHPRGTGIQVKLPVRTIE